MTSESDFRHAIFEAPDDDVPRLLFADWLEDQGDPRGELIRLQCHLARWEPDWRRRTQLQQREQELLAQNRAERAIQARQYPDEIQRKKGEPQ
jgi:uncharacterized protein (TIGR02996 family)